MEWQRKYLFPVSRVLLHFSQTHGKRALTWLTQDIVWARNMLVPLSFWYELNVCTIVSCWSSADFAIFHNRFSRYFSKFLNSWDRGRKKNILQMKIACFLRNKATSPCAEQVGIICRQLFISIFFFYIFHQYSESSIRINVCAFLVFTFETHTPIPDGATNTFSHSVFYFYFEPRVNFLFQHNSERVCTLTERVCIPVNWQQHV